MKKKSIIAFLIVFFAVFSSVIGNAENTNIDFSAKPVITSSQIGENDSYFNLRSIPGKVEDLPIKIMNHSKETTKYIVNINSATTNMNGIVDYTKPDVKQVETKHPFSSLIEDKEQVISIAGGEEKIVSVHLTMPKTSFDGVILGGIVVSKKIDETTESKNMIKNEFQYAIAVQLSENDKEISSKLEGGATQLTQINKRNAVQMSIKNPQPKLMKQVEGTFTIKRKNQHDVLVKETRKEMSFAPNSAFTLFTMLNDKVQPGEYTYTINLTNQEGEWTFSEDFVVNQKEASKLNKQSVDKTIQKNSSLGSLVVILGIIIVILLAALGYIFWKLQQDKKGN